MFSKSADTKVFRCFWEHNFHNWRTFKFWVQICQKTRLNTLWTVKRGWEKLKLRLVFPVKPIIKTHVSLCKSCSPIVPLQHSYLKIFNFVLQISSFAFLKSAAEYKMGVGAGVAALSHACAPILLRPRVAYAALRGTDTSCPSLQTRALWTLRPTANCTPRPRAHAPAHAMPYDNTPRKIPYYRLNQSTLVIKR
jgi:hypothetical protein